MRFGDFTYVQIRRFAKEGALVVVPTGCTEQQGPHLTVDFDTWFAENICVSAADQAVVTYGIDVLVLPAIPFGPTPEHRDFGAGFIDIPEELHKGVVRATLQSLADQGFRKIVVWRGCGQHRLDRVVEEFNSGRLTGARAFLPDQPYHDIWVKYGDPRDPGGHADSFATSIALYLRPDHVRQDKIVDSGCKPINWNDPNLNFAHYSPNGVVGTPIYASAALGEALWKEAVAHVAATFWKIKKV
jgi:creatinine amidohydrolase